MIPTTSVPSPAVPMARLVRVESRKQVNTRAGFGLLLALGILILLLPVPSLWLVEPSGMSFGLFLEAALLPQSILVPVIAIVAATSEWSRRTALVTFALEPRRLRVVGAQLVAVLGIALTVFLAGIVCATVVYSAAILFRGAAHDWTVQPALIAGLALSQVVCMAWGYAVGLLIGTTATAIVAFYLIPTAWTIAGFVFPVLAGAAGWLDVNRTLEPFLRPGVGASEILPLVTSLAVWVLLPLILGSLRVRRKDIR
ncbi:hypothetical protein [Mycetocola zhadangensis]|uniref:Uncharacterized protein n=1 Tax=Mycetocola zhadangensis TaxID=1164595 RepID=A0A3L7J1J2_9MICO|nr:hypothetical protein [Mycetocola zhadangensis]RLQ84393.1 hypothetical protein D9V28_09360 [Mycetocola zhadangensis]GGE93358.1 hypothetical protein GCM10011313_15520 [Mycetocola zhadangensis]